MEKVFSSTTRQLCKLSMVQNLVIPIMILGRDQEQQADVVLTSLFRKIKIILQALKIYQEVMGPLMMGLLTRYDNSKASQEPVIPILRSCQPRIRVPVVMTTATMIHKFVMLSIKKHIIDDHFHTIRHQVAQVGAMQIWIQVN